MPTIKIEDLINSYDNEETHIIKTIQNIFAELAESCSEEYDSSEDRCLFFSNRKRDNDIIGQCSNTPHKYHLCPKHKLLSNTVKVKCEEILGEPTNNIVIVEPKKRTLCVHVGCETMTVNEYCSKHKTKTICNIVNVTQKKSTDKKVAILDKKVTASNKKVTTSDKKVTASNKKVTASDKKTAIKKRAFTKPITRKIERFDDDMSSDGIESVTESVTESDTESIEYQYTE